MTSRARKTDTAFQKVDDRTAADESLKAVAPQAKPLTQVAGHNMAIDAPAAREVAGKDAPRGARKKVAAKATLGKSDVSSEETRAADARAESPNPAFTPRAAALVAARQKMTSTTQATPSASRDTVMEDNAQLTDKQVAEKKLTRKVEAPVPAGRPMGRSTYDVAEVSVPSADKGVPKVAAKAPVATKHPFKTLEYVVYPAHGVGQIITIEEQEVAGYKLELFVISFIKDKMILKVPLPKIASVGMRKLAEAPVVKRALDTLMGRARVKRTMWSRRAQEYEAKINSGDLVSIAEVVRDLYRSDAQPEQSYSERQLYEAALDRMAREIAAVQGLTDSEALKVIDGQLQKGPRRVKADEVEDAETDDADGGEGEGGIVAAA